MARIRSLLGLVIFLALWEVLARSGLIAPDRFPSLSEIASSLVTELASPKFVSHVLATWSRALVGLGLAIVLGLALALLAGNFRIVHQCLAPAVDMLRVIPPPAIVPLSMFALGLGTPLFIFIIVFASIWPIYINAANALSSPEPVQMAMARSLGYAQAETLLRIRLPAALPEIFTGIRIATGTALLATIAAEMLAGSSGLGHLLFEAGFSMRTPEMFGIMLLIGVSGVLLNGLLGIVRRLAIGWHMQLAAMADT